MTRASQRRSFYPVAEPNLGARELEYVSDAVRSGWVSSRGPYVDRFERAIAADLGVAWAISTANGTVALHLALAGAAFAPGDEVIVPAVTFVATASAVVHAGLRPVFADIDARTWCLDPDAVERAVSPRTRAIVPVHLYGHPAPMSEVLAIARAHRLLVIEDAAEAHAAEYLGRLVGSLGDLGVFSFYGNKTVTTGEGGVIVGNDAATLERLRLLRNHGMQCDRPYWHPVLGFNYRLTNLQAALGLAQWERLREFVECKRRIAAWYRQRLDGVNGLRCNPCAAYANSSHWMSTVLLPERTTAAERERLRERLRKAGIDTRPFFHPLHQQPPFRALPSQCPVAESIAPRGFCLPSSTTLAEADVAWISDRVLEAVGKVQRVMAS